jgi:SRSO17 transposase
MVVKEQEVEAELKSILRGEEFLRDLHTCIASRFRPKEVHERAFRFLQGLLAPVERKNGWQLAEELEEYGPRGVQRLLGDTDWDEEAVRDDLREYVVQHLGKEQSVLVIDETGFGKKSVGGREIVLWNSRKARKCTNRRLLSLCLDQRICFPGSITLSARGMDARSSAMSSGWRS